jgi:hypothetical protein
MTAAQKGLLGNDDSHKKAYLAMMTATKKLTWQ